MGVVFVEVAMGAFAEGVGRIAPSTSKSSYVEGVLSHALMGGDESSLS
jgi:hypothetical protein